METFLKLVIIFAIFFGAEKAAHFTYYITLIDADPRCGLLLKAASDVITLVTVK